MKHITVLLLKNTPNLLAFKKRKSCKAFIKKILPDKKRYKILKLELQN